jgi:hypothetical protein
MFKDIDIWPGYAVDQEGNVKSPRNKLLKAGTKGNYKCIQVSIEGAPKWQYVHRLVAGAFIPNPNNKPYVNHIDGNKMNNTSSNLEWVTHKENMEHYIKSVYGIDYISDSRKRSKGISIKKLKDMILSLPEDYPIRNLLDML